MDSTINTDFTIEEITLLASMFEKDKEVLKKELLWRKIWAGSTPIDRPGLITWLIQHRGFAGNQASGSVYNVKDISHLRYRKDPYPSIICGLYWQSKQTGLELIKLNVDNGATKAKIGRLGYSKLSTHTNYGTIITESLANAFVHAIYGFNSIILHGISNLAYVKEILDYEKIKPKDVILWLDSYVFGSKLYYRTKKASEILPELLVLEAFKHRKNNWDVNDELIEANNKRGNLDIYYNLVSEYLKGRKNG